MKKGNILLLSLITGITLPFIMPKEIPNVRQKAIIKNESLMDAGGVSLKLISALRENQMINFVKTAENYNDIENTKTKEIETKTLNNTQDITNQPQEFNVFVSYYTHLSHCTTSGNGITASGKKVSNTSVAIPRKDSLLKFGDTIIFEKLADGYMRDYKGQYLTRVADDTGNTKYIRKIDSNTYKLDVYCPPFQGESENEYLKRVKSYGITKTKFILKKEK